ncbi:hypothetical protein BVY02_00775 [bacterium J17]|nr:hypothetical protein BVY02_00775 [bacterium J17]
MLTLELEKRIDTNFFRPSASLITNATLKANEEETIDVLSFFREFIKLNSLIPSLPTRMENLWPNASVIGELENLRGRPPESFTKSQQKKPSLNKQPIEEELIFLRGVVALGKEESEIDLLDQEGPTEEIPFHYQLNSTFSRILGTKTILHSTVTHASKEFKELDFDEEDPKTYFENRLRADELRIGLEFYKSRFYGSMLGFAPAVDSHLYLEMSDGQIAINSKQEVPKKSREIPEGAKLLEIVATIDQILKNMQLHETFASEFHEALLSS